MTKPDLRITTAVASALALVACGQSFNQDDGWTAAENTAVCTDRQGQRVEDRNCSQQSRQAHPNMFLWYYLMRGGSVPPYGERVAGGSYARPAGASFTSSSASAATIARGGFGSSAHFSAGE